MTANAKPLLLFENRFADGIPTATNSLAGYDVLNIIDGRTYTFWMASAAGTLYITIDCGSPQAADTLGIVHNNLYTANASVSVESSDNGADWTERLAPFVPTSNKALLKIFTSVTAQWWRLKIVTVSIAPKIAVAMLGARMDFERFPLLGIDPDAEQIVAETSVSKAGFPLGSVIRYYQKNISISFSNLTPDWVKNTFKPAYEDYLSLLQPFFIAWELINHADEIYFVILPDDHSLAMPYDAVRRRLTLRMITARE